jgi:hypothetical protein
MGANGGTSNSINSGTGNSINYSTTNGTNDRTNCYSESLDEGGAFKTATFAGTFASASRSASFFATAVWRAAVTRCVLRDGFTATERAGGIAWRFTGRVGSPRRSWPGTGRERRP